MMKDIISFFFERYVFRLFVNLIKKFLKIIENHIKERIHI
jgi:hypothetical protein